MNDPGCFAWRYQLYLHIANTGMVMRYATDLWPVDAEGVVGKRRPGAELNGFDVEAFETQLHRQCPYCRLPYDYRVAVFFAYGTCHPLPTASSSAVLAAV
jgi:hypothetical protein